MGKIRRAIADFIRSRRVDDKRHPRFQAGYLAGLYDARLEAETTHEDGIIRLEKWPEEHVLWYHGEIVWRSGSSAAPAPDKHVAPDTAARLERILRVGRSMKWTPHGAPALDDEDTAVALGELFQIFFQDAVDRALATTESSDNG